MGAALVAVVVEHFRDTVAPLAERLRPYVTDTTAFLQQAIQSGKRLLFEGAQGSLLDIDHGTFPYVTSSSCSALGLFTGAGVPPQSVRSSSIESTNLNGGRCGRMSGVT